LKGLVHGFDAALRLVRNYIAGHVDARLEALLGSEVVGHLLALPFRHFETIPSGLISERIR
jgi:ABC-type bacteriocin/lantibiotic exporter with double-glycine peptidase domain